MNVASLELCKELYELSGWVGAGQEWSDWYSGELEYGKGDELYQSDWRVVSTAPWRDANTTPAYDLGYLLRKLPNYQEYWNGGNEAGYLKLIHYSKHWSCGYDDDQEGKADSLMVHLNDTPEDAACKLAIELFKQGVLTKK